MNLKKDITPEMNKSETNTLISNLERVSQPLNQSELEEFRTKLNRGFKAVDYPSRNKKKILDDTHKLSLASSNSKTGSLSLDEDIFYWLSETLDDHFNKTPRNHADSALIEFVELPASKENLLNFFRSFAAAYKKMVCLRTELQSGTYSGADKAVFMIAHASAFKERTLKRLEVLGKLELIFPEDFELFSLYAFAGCTPEEIAMYLDRDTEVVSNKISNMEFELIQV